MGKDRAFSALEEMGVSVFEYDELGSTNTAAREYAQLCGKAPALILAKKQTEGRGRMGRSFYSPADTGLYMTLLLDVTHDTPHSFVGLTTAAAVATARAIERTTGILVGIKWVNDLYIEQKKVCGILCESFSSGEKRYAIIGIGVNLSTADFPEEIRDIAASLGVADACLVRQRLAESICICLLGIYGQMRAGDTSYIGEYKRRSVVLGREVTFTVGDRQGSGVAEDIDADGALYVRCSDGRLEALNSGEISLRIRKEDGK